MSNCTELDSVKWTEPGNLISLAVLAFINVLVIVGNCLVIAAVFCSHKLRSVTNFFIVSLAVADLLVGLAVLPFSATWEVFKVCSAYSSASTHYITYNTILLPSVNIIRVKIVSKWKYVIIIVIIHKYNRVSDPLRKCRCTLYKMYRYFLE